jgi:hypothetical protein
MLETDLCRGFQIFKDLDNAALRHLQNAIVSWRAIEGLLTLLPSLARVKNTV